MFKSFFVVDNIFYGDEVTTSGLLTGRDIIDTIKGKPLGEAVWASYRILNDEGILTLNEELLDSPEIDLDFEKFLEKRRNKLN